MSRNSRRITIGTVLCAFCLRCWTVGAFLIGDEPPTAPDQEESAARKEQREANLKAMERRAREMKVRPAEMPNQEVTMVPKPLFHYTDEPRRILDGTLWGWLSQGRLLAICKIENYAQSAQAGQWLYCLGSLSPDLIEAEWEDGHRWSASKPGILLQAIERWPAAAEGKPARLRQMKELVGRFEATMSDQGASQQMRLLPRPLYRYENAAGELLDGAVFGLTSNGTNPDAILLLELHQSEGRAAQWMFGVSGMTASALSIKLGETEVWSKPVTATLGSYKTWTWFWENPR